MGQTYEKMVNYGLKSMDRVPLLIGDKCIVRFSETIDETLWSEINLRENSEFWVYGARCSGDRGVG